MGLKKYHEKRNFRITREPKGKSSRRKKNLYVIQKHAASRLHYDFRLELNSTLISWAIPKGPCLDPSIKRLSVHVEDHPLEYANFEGIIPKGQYGAGVVLIWDKGTWMAEDKNPAKAYSKGDMTFTLKGTRLHGRWKLVRIHKDDKTWLLIKIKDEYAAPLKEYDITQLQPDSVVSHQSIDDIANAHRFMWDASRQKIIKTKNAVRVIKKEISLPKKLRLKIKQAKFPSRVTPELATLVDKPPAGKQWLHEIKFDGYRLIAFKKNGKTRLQTRNHHDWTDKFKNIANAIDKLPIKNAIFDGEVVLLDEHQHSDFQLLQHALTTHESQPFIYYLFDLIYYDKYDLGSLPLIERKSLLHKIIPSSEDPVLRYSDHVIGSGQVVFEKSCEIALEGIVSKQTKSLYVQKRTADWLKIKCLKHQEFTIGGFTQPKGSRASFGALLVGTYNKRNELIYHGKVGSGFTEGSLTSIFQILKKHVTQQMPFHQFKTNIKNVTWVKPAIIAEIEFTEWTKDGLLRQPVLKGLHHDNPLPHTLTNPDKLLYPLSHLSKKDIADYYESIQDWILPYITWRPLALVRCPNGFEHGFFQKHITSSSPASFHGITIKENERKEKCIYIEDTAGLMAMPQLAVLEIHPSGSRIEKIDYPDMITFDLDPAPDLPWKKVVAAAFEVKKYLNDFNIRSFVKTTGGKGIHIVIPIKPQHEWNEIKLFAKTFADFVTMRHPDKYTNVMSKAKRRGKIYIDYLRNQKGATAIAPYSPRARIHATVAAPVDWDELTNDIRDTLYTIKTLPARLHQLKKDPWGDFFKVKQSLNLDKL